MKKDDNINVWFLVFMDNQILIQELEKAYSIIDASNTELDNKSINMIIIIGAMLSLQVSFLFPLTCNYISIICLISLFCYSIALILFIKPLITKKFKVYPNIDAVKEYYEYDYDDAEYQEQVLGRYNDVITFNEEQILSKGKYSWLGFYFLIFGVIFTVLTVLLMVVTSYV